MKSESGGFLLKIIQPIDLMKRQFTKPGELICFTRELILLKIKPLFFKCVLRESYVKTLIAI